MTLSAVVVFGGSVACTPIAAGAAARRIMCLAGSSSPRVPCAIRRNFVCFERRLVLQRAVLRNTDAEESTADGAQAIQNYSRLYSLHDVGGQRTRDENGPSASDQIISAKRCSVLMSIIGGPQSRFYRTSKLFLPHVFLDCQSSFCFSGRDTSCRLFARPP